MCTVHCLFKYRSGQNGSKLLLLAAKRIDPKRIQARRGPNWPKLALKSPVRKAKSKRGSAKEAEALDDLHASAPWWVQKCGLTMRSPSTNPETLQPTLKPAGS